MADQLYRANAQRSMRRVMAMLYPDDWDKRMARHGELVAKGYDKAAVDELQAFESRLIADASTELTRIQAASDVATERKDYLDGWRTLIQLAGFYFVQILTILIFFLKEDAKGRQDSVIPIGMISKAS